MRQFIDFFLSIRDSKFFTGLVISVIAASAIYAGASSYDIPNQYTTILDYFDYAITIFFLIEILIRIFAEANHPLRFFKNGWNIFDLVIVLVSRRKRFCRASLKNRSSASNHYSNPCISPHRRIAL
jgi:voltage-gated sodium channel